MLDATGQALAYVYARESEADANTAKVLTMDEARRIAANIAKLPVLLTGGVGMGSDQLKKWQRDLEQAENALKNLDDLETAEQDRIEWESQAKEARRKIVEEMQRKKEAGLGDVEDN